MSDFGTDRIVLDHRARTAVSDGVELTRRCVLRLGTSSLAALGLLAGCSATAARADETLEFDELLDELHPRARRVVRTGGEREEAYLQGVRELLARLRVPEGAELRRQMRAFREAHESLELSIVQFELEPGKGFSHHDHRDYNGVILGMEGEVRARNFDVVGETRVPPAGETFQIRLTRDERILPGEFSTLSRTRDNVHELVAGPEGARVLDVFTYFSGSARSYFMDVDPVPRDAEREIFDAAWS